MTNEEIKRELSKIPEEDKVKIKSVQSLSNEEMENVTGGVAETTEAILQKLHLDKKLSQTTKNILEKLLLAGGIILTAGGIYYVGYNRGYNKGYTSSIVDSLTD